MTSANYFFGFIITFVVLLLLFVGCGVGSRRRFGFIGRAWDERMQDMDEGAFEGRGAGSTGRKRLVRPIFWETWTDPRRDLAGKISQEASWEGVQPLSASFIRPPSKPPAGEQSKSGPLSLGTSSSQTSITNSQSHAQLHRLQTTLNSYLFRRPRPHTNHPPEPEPPERPLPEAVQITVVICMPSSSTSALGNSEGPSAYSSGEQTSLLGEYQVGITQLPWTSGDIS